MLLKSNLQDSNSQLFLIIWRKFSSIKLKVKLTHSGSPNCSTLLESKFQLTFFSVSTVKILEANNILLRYFIQKTIFSFPWILAASGVSFLLTTITTNGKSFSYFVIITLNSRCSFPNYVLPSCANYFLMDVIPLPRILNGRYFRYFKLTNGLQCFSK